MAAGKLDFGTGTEGGRLGQRPDMRLYYSPNKQVIEAGRRHMEEREGRVGLWE